MITNERQYRITRRKADGFEHAIREIDATPHSRPDAHPRLVQAEREAIESQLADLREELEEYERLQSPEVSIISVSSFEEFADGLIKARIAAGLSQRALAQRLNLKEQQIQGYEAERYASASYRRLCEVAGALELRMETKFHIPPLRTALEDRSPG